ncbi:MAG: hypothetical protein E7530_05715 [Ruminococcaceae bacterium]|nr:hypothetical protein [Oscillospiraceae bacterium]
MTMSESLLLKVITPEKEYIYDNCDSVSFCVSDNQKGNGGGRYGIRKGHAKAVFSLDNGKLSASKNSEGVVEMITSSGFAKVEDNTVTVIVDELQII